MTEPANEASDLRRRLEDGLTRLGRIVAAVPDRAAWDRRGEDEWSAHEVLVHLRASSEILAPRIPQMLVRDNPPLTAFDERKWAEIGGYAAMAPDLLFARIAMPRYELIELLRRLPDEAWRRTGTHEVSGPVTIAQVVAHLAGHDEEHLDQIERLLGVTGSAPAAG